MRNFLILILIIFMFCLCLNKNKESYQEQSEEQDSDQMGAFNIQSWDGDYKDYTLSNNEFKNAVDRIKGKSGTQGTGGDIGFQGNEGPQGPKGFKGVRGVVGSRGFHGEVGRSGNQGSPGNKGVIQGYRYTPSTNYDQSKLTIDGTLSSKLVCVGNVCLTEKQLEKLKKFEPDINNIVLRNISDSHSVAYLKLWQNIPIKKHTDLSKSEITLTWKDQGHGNRKGRIFARFKDSPKNTGYYKISGLAEHSFKTQKLKFPAVISEKKINNDTVLELWYVVGGGGGHKLFIKDAHFSVKLSSAEVSSIESMKPVEEIILPIPKVLELKKNTSLDLAINIKDILLNIYKKPEGVKTRKIRLQAIHTPTIESLEFELRTSQRAIFYQHGNYRGYSIELPEGEYKNKAEMITLSRKDISYLKINNDISSIKSNGLIIDLYSKENFQGAHLRVENNIPNLVGMPLNCPSGIDCSQDSDHQQGKWNDTISSIKVRQLMVTKFTDPYYVTDPHYDKTKFGGGLGAPGKTLKDYTGRLGELYFGHSNGGSNKAKDCFDLCKDDPKCNSFMWRDSGLACYLSTGNELIDRPGSCCKDHHPFIFHRSGNVEVNSNLIELKDDMLIPKVATENQVGECNGTVYYGKNGLNFHDMIKRNKYVKKNTNGDFYCNNSFLSDPDRGHIKQCMCHNNVKLFVTSDNDGLLKFLKLQVFDFY